MNNDLISREWIRKEVEEYRLKQAYDAGDEMRNTMVDWIEDDIDNAPPAPDWTPCFEKQPDKDGVYHVTVTFNGKSVTRDQVFHEGRWLPLGKLMVNGVSGEPEVIAWMEKPAPYQAPVLDLGRGM